MIGERNPWDRLADDLVKLDSDARHNLILGRPKTFEDYREEVGYLRALADVRDSISKIFPSER